MGVRVPDRCKRADLLASLAPKLRPVFSESSELLHLMKLTSLEANHVGVVHEEVRC